MEKNNYYIHNANIINEGRIFRGDVLIQDGIIKDVIRKHEGVDDLLFDDNTVFVEADGKYLMPGVIDAHVHFREPGMIQKADIASESKAAVAGGVTSYMDMPNTLPQTVSVELAEEKFAAAAEKSMANYSFYLGATAKNLQELSRLNPSDYCGIKVFLGSSTGNMLMDDPALLEELFAIATLPIVAHCEDEQIIKQNLQHYADLYGEDIPFSAHSAIRSREACLKSTNTAIQLAKKYNTRLHIAHVTTSEELELFDHTRALEHKNITSEVCVGHLWFDETQYDTLGCRIKSNPSIKSRNDAKDLLIGLLANKIDIVATDHAPHTWEEKDQPYAKSPSGFPMIQHSLRLMFEMYYRGLITPENIVEKMCHAPARMFDIDYRGFIRKGYQADLVLLDLNAPQVVTKDNLYYKCGWSPLEGTLLHTAVLKTFVNGELAYDAENADNPFNEQACGKRLHFNR